MKASEAEKNGWRCPACNGKTAQDVKGRGFVRHIPVCGGRLGR